ncbi:hypothetical protein, partial [bacterium endosymbiont of Bathymodiolus sp. 5 South]|uniref:hypothetical protein n=1 Tax=bacterium endosymbiont of Bathymodiolus sp. 5 South TaxID=1181670 RepID=UPI001C5A1D98
LRVKKICQKITNTTDINLTVIPIKKNGTTGVTIGYQFRSEFKNQKTITKIEDVKIIDSKPRSNRQQLSNWGVSKKQIDTWIANLDTKTINDAINQTLSRSKHKGNRSNSGGYIYLSGFTTLFPTFKNHTPKHIRLSDKQIRLQIIPIL